MPYKQELLKRNLIACGNLDKTASFSSALGEKIIFVKIGMIVETQPDSSNQTL